MTNTHYICVPISTSENFGASPGVISGVGAAASPGIGGGVGSTSLTGPTQNPGQVAGAPPEYTSDSNLKTLEQQLSASGLQKTDSAGLDSAAVILVTSITESKPEEKALIIRQKALGDVEGSSGDKFISDPSVISQAIQAQLKASSLGRSGGTFGGQQFVNKQSEEEDEPMFIESFTMKNNGKTYVTIGVIVILGIIIAILLKYKRSQQNET